MRRTAHSWAPETTSTMFTDKHLLLVDDQLDELKLLIEALRDTHCRLSIAFDGIQAYHRAQASVPDLIVMDVRMPRMDGFATSRLLAANPATQHIPIIFLTVADDVEERMEGFSAGGVDYVIKPYEPREVIARIGVHLRRQAAERDELPVIAHPTDGPLVRAAIRHLLDHLGAQHSLEALAQRLGTNEKRLSRAFRKNLGKSVFEYLREKRLERSLFLLTQTSLSIGAIAEETGFSSSANFATAFKERFGITASEYRRKPQAFAPGRGQLAAHEPEQHDAR
jgi:DNA-binding response OmpR family regulator